MTSAALISNGLAEPPLSMSSTRDGGMSPGLPAPAATTCSYNAWRTNWSRSNRLFVGALASSSFTAGGGAGMVENSFATSAFGAGASAMSLDDGGLGDTTVYVRPWG